MKLKTFQDIDRERETLARDFWLTVAYLVTGFVVGLVVSSHWIDEVCHYARH
jgi:hypothetical protein